MTTVYTTPEAISEEYKRTGQRYIQQADAEFEKGDFLQASEKAWKAAAQYVKALSVVRGLDHDGSQRTCASRQQSHSGTRLEAEPDPTTVQRCRRPARQLIRSLDARSGCQRGHSRCESADSPSRRCPAPRRRYSDSPTKSASVHPRQRRRHLKLIAGYYKLTPRRT